MEQQTAPTSGAIKVVTGLVLAMTAGFLLASPWVPPLLLGGAILVVTDLLCWLYAPVAYGLAGGQLTVRRRLGSKVFGPVIGCSAVTGKCSFGLRLWGNGGLFAGTGIFWNRQYGIFRAYVTSSRPQDQVLVQTEGRKILISPADPGAFIRGCG